MEEELEGFRVVAAALARLGVTHMFGVVGIPVVEVDAKMIISMMTLMMMMRRMIMMMMMMIMTMMMILYLVLEVAVAAQQEGIVYIGMRNEQAACYAAQVIHSCLVFPIYWELSNKGSYHRPGAT